MGKTQKSPRRSLVLTSIAGESCKVLVEYAKQCEQRGVSFVVIGDKKSPKSFRLEGADFWSVERQSSLDFKLAAITPYNHYARKNLGYLVAIQNESEVIVETDDDNLPKEGFWRVPQRQQAAKPLRQAGWV